MNRNTNKKKLSFTRLGSQMDLKSQDSWIPKISYDYLMKMTQQEETIEKKSQKKIWLGTFGKLRYFCGCLSKHKSDKIKFIEEGTKIIDKELNVANLLQKFQDIDKLKL